MGRGDGPGAAADATGSCGVNGEAMTESEWDDGVPSEVLMYAADEAILHGKPQILKSYGLIVVPDLTVLRAIGAGQELPDTFRLHTSDGREVMVYTYPGLEPVDPI